MLQYTNLETPEYVKNLTAAFAKHSDVDKAVKMSAYMKNRFEFFGIQSPDRKLLLRAFLSEAGYPKVDNLDEVVRELWQQPQRELHYAAQELASAKAYMASDKRIHLIEYMITNKSWWDTVDYIASNLAGSWFMKHPQRIAPVTEAWMESDNLWLQRAALLFQLKYKKKTDEALLYSYIRRLTSEQDFFIRKAIGWALREYAKTNPHSVKTFVNNVKLSPLSRKEALKSISAQSPDGQEQIVPTITWYLEMKSEPLEYQRELPEGYTVIPFSATDRLGTYLEIYKAVGGNFNWFDRLLMPAEELASKLNSTTTEICLLMHGDEVAGFVEYDHSEEGETEIVYFGLTTRHTGKKAGYPFLLWAISHAWQKPITRLWLHTCDLDHPAALPLYQKAGFNVYKSEMVMQRVVRG